MSYDYDLENFIQEKMLIEPEAPLVLQNSVLWPNKYIPYHLALLYVEKQKFPNFFAESQQHNRAKWERKRILEPVKYTRLLDVKFSLKETEEIRTQAKNFLTNAIIENSIKTYMLILKEDPQTELEFLPLPKEWWKTQNPYQIDGFSQFIVRKRDRFIFKGQIALDRNDTERWGATVDNALSRRGRKEKNDDEALVFMHKHITDENLAVSEAARKAFHLFKTNEIESTYIDRLRKKYRKAYE
jgi:hypothetical protein